MSGRMSPTTVDTESLIIVLTPPQRYLLMYKAPATTCTAENRRQGLRRDCNNHQQHETTPLAETNSLEIEGTCVRAKAKTINAICDVSIAR
ncbi:hypothetical protein Trydic_g18146 [Trypoxylus dichotomus]